MNRVVEILMHRDSLTQQEAENRKTKRLKKENENGTFNWNFNLFCHY